MSNDVINAMIAGTDTSRNVTIFLVTSLVKNKANKQRVRDEIVKSMEKQNIGDVLDMGHKELNPSDFEYLNWAINESMRLNPTILASE